MYNIANSDLCLVGTAEIPLAALYYNTIIPKEKLPIRMCAYGHCFRAETGGSGASSKGLYRVHQFSKVEMFVVSEPSQSAVLHEELLEIEVEILKELGLHFRVLDMPATDLGAPAYRKFDIEAWMPFREGFGEVTSASNCTDYQSRRLNIRCSNPTGQNNQYVHTLNATAAAIPRLTLAILENLQDVNGDISIPKVLVPFMGKTHISNKQRR